MNVCRVVLLALVLAGECAVASPIDLREGEVFGTLTVPMGEGTVNQFGVHFERRAGISRVYGVDPTGRYLVATDDGTGLEGDITGGDGIFPLGKSALPLARWTRDQLDLANDTVRLPSARVVSGPATKVDTGETRLDVLVLYTARLLEQMGRPWLDEFVAASENRLNASFANSSIPFTARIVAVEQSDQADPPDESLYEFILRACGATETSNNRETLQSRFHADIYTFLTGSKATNPRGLANVYDGGPAEEYARVACSVMDTFAGEKPKEIVTIFVHEVGHVLGGGHDRMDPNHGGGWKEYSHAANCGENAQHTPLATALSLNGIIQPFFSTPDRTAGNGDPCGFAAGMPNSADNARVVADNREWKYAHGNAERFLDGAGDYLHRRERGTYDDRDQSDR